MDRTKAVEALVLVAENVADTTPTYEKHEALREILATVAAQYGVTLFELTKTESAQVRRAYEARRRTTP